LGKKVALNVKDCIIAAWSDSKHIFDAGSPSTTRMLNYYIEQSNIWTDVAPEEENSKLRLLQKKQGFSSRVFEFDTKSWLWKKLLHSSLEESPLSLQSACVASLGNNQCIVFGGETMQNDWVIPSDETKSIVII